VLIRLHLDHITLLDRQAAAIEDEIEAVLDAVPAAWGVGADGVPSASPRPDAPVLPAAERLAEIPGVSLRLTREIIAESGRDMTRFPTAGHPVSWAGLAPVARQSGPQQRKPSCAVGRSILGNWHLLAGLQPGPVPPAPAPRRRREHLSERC
jgi:transposase